ncbi:MAG TPA: hypothetical protein VFI31_06905 [Pirellulales bacterium]|nr:hypothetical protein [Pirellulales bacterium]
MIETVLGGAPRVVLARPTDSASDHTDKWKALEDRIAGWAPAHKALHRGGVHPGHANVGARIAFERQERIPIEQAVERILKQRGSSRQRGNKT